MSNPQLTQERKVNPRLTQERKVYDSIYGFISFSKLIWEFIDSPHFQRLRNIKQLGCLSWVFPGAMHTRFQHSLGTGHLAKRYISILIQKHKDKNLNEKVWSDYYQTKTQTEYTSTIDEAIFIVTLAGLLHDIGHGPFSHLFDSKVVNKIKFKEDDEKEKTWEHQIASLCLIDGLYKYVIKKKDAKKDEKQINWLQSTKNRVKALIIGKIYKKDYEKDKEGKYFLKGFKEVDNLQEGFNKIFKTQLGTRPWEFELISNRITGIDVDKLDYFRRDAHYLGAKNIYIDHQLLMNESLILKDEYFIPLDGESEQCYTHRIAYPDKYSDKVYDVFYSRYKLYKTYYMNLKAGGVDLMIGDILQLAELEFGFKNICRSLLQGNCDHYIKLTDTILERIDIAYQNVVEKMQKQKLQLENLKKKDQKIYKAGTLLEKLKSRQVYDFLKESHMCFSQIPQYKKVCDDIDTLKSQEQKKQRKVKLIYHNSDIGFGIKDKDLFKLCKFYDKAKQKAQIQKFSESQFSMLKPEKTIEVTIRAYMKEKIKYPTDNEKKYIRDLQEQIQDLLQKKVHTKFQRGPTGGTIKRPKREDSEQADAQRQPNHGDRSV